MLVRSENRWLYRDVTRQTKNCSVWSAFELVLPLWWCPAHLSRDNSGGSATEWPRDVPGGPRWLSPQARRTLNGWALLGTVVASTPSSNMIGWLNRLVLASCGQSSTPLQGLNQFELPRSRLWASSLSVEFFVESFGYGEIWFMVLLWSITWFNHNQLKFKLWVGQE